MHRLVDERALAQPAGRDRGELSRARDDQLPLFAQHLVDRVLDALWDLAELRQSAVLPFKLAITVLLAPTWSDSLDPRRQPSLDDWDGDHTCVPPAVYEAALPFMAACDEAALDAERVISYVEKELVPAIKTIDHARSMGKTPPPWEE